MSDAAGSWKLMSDEDENFKILVSKDLGFSKILQKSSKYFQNIFKNLQNLQNFTKISEISQNFLFKICPKSSINEWDFSFGSDSLVKTPLSRFSEPLNWKKFIFWSSKSQNFQRFSRTPYIRRKFTLLFLFYDILNFSRGERKNFIIPS